MKIRILSSLFATLLLSTGCSDDVGKPKPVLPPANADAAMADDTGAGDTGTNESQMDSGAMTVDTGTPLTAACMELAVCCEDAPAQLQAQCDGPIAANDDARCRETLSMAQGFGLCLPPDHDAGTRPGPQGPRCQALLSCCPELGIEFLVTACEGIANDGDEATCDMRLMQAQGANICLDPPDAGVNMDAGTSSTAMDAGTSTTGMDAGTSSVADGG